MIGMLRESSSDKIHLYQLTTGYSGGGEYGMWVSNDRALTTLEDIHVYTTGGVPGVRWEWGGGIEIRDIKGRDELILYATHKGMHDPVVINYFVADRVGDGVNPQPEDPGSEGSGSGGCRTNAFAFSTFIAALLFLSVRAARKGKI